MYIHMKKHLVFAAMKIPSSVHHWVINMWQYAILAPVWFSAGLPDLSCLPRVRGALTHEVIGSGCSSIRWQHFLLGKCKVEHPDPAQDPATRLGW
jgi:hypothetical protein